MMLAHKFVPTGAPPHATRPKPPHIATLIFCTALPVLTLNMMLPSLPQIALEFQVDYALVNLSVAGILVVTAVLQILFGPLSDRFGRRPVLLLTVAIYIVASLGAALGQGIWVFLGFRMIQGVIVAATVMSRAAIRDIYPPNQAASRLGYVSMAMALAPMLGPMLGGALDVAFGWRSGFVLYFLLGLTLLVLSWTDFGETNRAPSTTFARQFRDYPELFAARRFWGYALCAGFSVGGYFCFIAGAPLVAAAWFDLSPAALGLGIGIITGGFMLGSFITGRFAARTSLIAMILAGRIATVAGLLVGLGLFALGQGHVLVFFGAAVFVGFGNGLTVPNATAGLMSVRPHLAGSASGLAGALTSAIGAVLASLTGVVVSAQNAPFAVLGMMLGSGVLALVSALYVRLLDRQAPLPLKR